MNADYLIDSSVTGRLGESEVRHHVAPLIARGLVATCALLDIEVGYTARSLGDWDQLMADRKLLYPWAPMPQDGMEQALLLQRRLVASRIHRGVGIPDLLIAVTAAFNNLTVLHQDHDFELIADVYDVQVQRVPPGPA